MKRDLSKECQAEGTWGGFDLRCILPPGHKGKHRANGVEWQGDLRKKCACAGG